MDPKKLTIQAHYILDRKVAKRAESIDEWLTWFREIKNRIVKQTMIHEVKVSTVLFGISYEVQTMQYVTMALGARRMNFRSDIPLEMRQ